MNNIMFTHTYNTTGQKNIILRVTDERMLTSTDQVSILIINSSYAFAFVDKPSYDERINSNMVDFDASSTFMIETNFMTDTLTITCLAGLCPSQTEGCPPYPPYDATPNCNISIQNAPADVASADYSILDFNWTFDATTTFTHSGRDSAGYEFSKLFIDAERHIATLDVTDKDLTVSASLQSPFVLYFTEPRCIIEDGVSYWNENGGVFTRSINDCYRPDGTDTSGNVQTTCCPSSGLTECNINTGKCQLGPQFCEQADTQEVCEGLTVASPQLNDILQQDYGLNCTINEADFGKFCHQRVECGCKWEASDSECISFSEHEITDRNTGLPIGSGSQGICNSTGRIIENEQRCEFDFSIVDNCDSTGFIDRTWTVEWLNSDGTPSSTLPPLYCQPGDDQVTCENIVKLPFFGLWQVILTIVSLAGIYFIFRRRFDIY